MVRVPATLVLLALGVAACRARLPVEHIPATIAPAAVPPVSAPAPVAAPLRVEYYKISDG